MPFIGNQPTAVPLTGADIEDGTIQASDLNLADTYAFTGTVTGAGGITEYDIWRLTATLSISGNSSTSITSNLERVDTFSPGFIGTGMTESSGVFTFPSTGIWEIFASAQVYGGLDITYFRTMTEISTDGGSSFAETTDANCHTHNGYFTTQTVITSFDVTNTSTHKMRFRIRHGNSGNLQGNTNVSGTYFRFMRLGDT